MDKEKIFSYGIGAMLLTAVIVAGGMVAFNQGMAYQAALDEGIGVQKVPFGAYMTFTVIHEDGSSTLAWAGHNLMTTTGLNACRWMISGAPAANANFSWIAIGTGTGAKAASNTTLETEIFRESATFDNSSTVAGNWTLIYTWAAGIFSGQAVTEAGVFNAASGGIMLNVQTFSAITLTSSDSLQVTFEFQIAQG